MTANSANAHFSVRLVINQQFYTPADYSVVLDGNNPGRAQFQVKGHFQQRTPVYLELGWGEVLHPAFVGYIDQVTDAGAGFQHLFCRELSALLFSPMQIMLRHPSLPQLLDQVHSHTQLHFTLPEKRYSKTVIPCFYCFGSGFRLMESIADAFAIPQFIWQQQDDGSIWLGSWLDSPFAQVRAQVPADILTTHADDRGECACIPYLKPNMLLNGKRVEKVEHHAAKTVITWI